MAQITLAYDVEIPETMSDAAFAALVNGADIFVGELTFLSMSVNSDITAVIGSNARRTIVLDTDAESDAMFPTDAEKIGATANLYTTALALKVPGVVDAIEPVVS